MKLITHCKNLREKLLHQKKSITAKDNEKKIYNVKSYYNYFNIFFISKTLMIFNFLKNILFLSYQTKIEWLISEGNFFIYSDYLLVK